MANYINEEILAESYSHLEVDIFDDKEALEKLKRELEIFFGERAKYLFGEQIKIEIEFEEGSLRTRIKVVASAAVVILTAMNTYGSFRQTVDYLAKDSVMLAQSAGLEMIFRTKAAYCNRVAVEKRRGVFGKVHDLIGELDIIKRNISNSELPSDTTKLDDFSTNVKRLSNWQAGANKLFSKFGDDATKACVAAGLLEELNLFPSQAPWTPALSQNSFRAELIKADPQLAVGVEVEAARFKETVQYVRKYYEDMVKQYEPQAS